MRRGTWLRLATTVVGAWALGLAWGAPGRAETRATVEPDAVGAVIAPAPAATPPAVTPPAATPSAAILPAATAVAPTTPPTAEPTRTDDRTAAATASAALPEALGDPLAALRAFDAEAFPPPRQPAAGVVVTGPGGDARGRAERGPIAAHLSSWNPTAVLRSDAGDQPGPDPALPGLQPPSRAWAQLRLPDLPIRWDPKLIRYLEFYRSDPRGRAILGTWLARVGRYAPLIEARLQAQGLPRALIYVAMIESAFDPLRTSPAGAAGLWQFMVGTGRAYGLRRDAWIDERRNPERSTDAALRYLKNLYRRLGSWELALAAYNAGFGAVVEAMQKYNTNDYWRLCRYEAGLPWDTTLYVPKILAAAIVGANRAAFGFRDVVSEPALAHELVSVRGSMSLGELAQASGGPIEQLRLLNPELRRGRTPPHAGVWVRVPAGTSARFYAAVARSRSASARYAAYEVRLGETLEDIALRHGTTSRALRQLNELGAGAPLRAGAALLVPRAARTPTTADATGAPAALPTSHATDAPRAGPSGDETVVVALPSDAPNAIAGRRRVFYRTVLGDRLPRVARHLGVTEAELVRWNGLDPRARLVSKMVLQAFVALDFSDARVQLLPTERVALAVAGSEAFLDAHEQRKGRRRQVYSARPGDTLLRVARRFGLSLGDLMRINGLGATAPLLAGQRLLVYLPGPAATEGRRARAAAATSARVASNAAP